MPTTVGKICSKHPEAVGVRVLPSYNCIECIRAAARAGAKRRYAARKAAGGRYFGSRCQEHPELKGERHPNGCCVGCHRVKVKKSPGHKARQRQHARFRKDLKSVRTPKWVKRGELTACYVEAMAKGLTVDHIVPLRHPLVSGLHCPSNFKYISLEKNVAKGNKFIVG